MASDKRVQVLDIEPPHELVFRGPFDDVVTSSLTVRNPTNTTVIFKVKTTAPKQYCVRPGNGVLGPYQEQLVAVMLQPCDINMIYPMRHKFMVQSMIAPPDFSMEKLDVIWRTCSRNLVMDSKLQCVLLEEGESRKVPQQPQQAASVPATTTQNLQQRLDDALAEIEQQITTSRNLQQRLDDALAEIEQLQQQATAIAGSTTSCFPRWSVPECFTQ